MEISEQPLITKLGMPSSPTVLDGFMRFRALQISDSEMRAKGKKSEDRERRGIPLYKEYYKLK
jgi:hypothetical protein